MHPGTPLRLSLPPMAGCPAQMADAVELLRLGSFFSNAALVAQLCGHLAGQMAGLPEETVLEVGRGKGASVEGRGGHGVCCARCALGLQRWQLLPALCTDGGGASNTKPGLCHPPSPSNLLPAGVPRRGGAEAAPARHRVPGAAAAAVWAQHQRQHGCAGLAVGAGGVMLPPLPLTPAGMHVLAGAPAPPQASAQGSRASLPTPELA